MKRFFLIPVLALFTCVNMWADDPVLIATVATKPQQSYYHGIGTNTTTTFYYSTSDDAFEAAATVATSNKKAMNLYKDVTLKSDITITSTQLINISSTVTINLNGHSLINNASSGNMFSFADNNAPANTTLTIKNGSITKTSTCNYPIRLYNLNNMSVVLEDVIIDEGSQVALYISYKNNSTGNVTVQGTCTIPSIKLGGSYAARLANAEGSTLTTSIIEDGLKTKMKTITNNGTLNLGAKTSCVGDAGTYTKAGTGTWTVVPGAEFTNGAWDAMGLADYCTSQGYKVESAVQQNTWNIIKKVRDSNYNPTPKARLNGQDYPSVQVAMAVAYAAGGEQTVTLLADDDYETTATISSDADITLDLNHHVLTVKQKIDFQCGNGFHGKLTVRDGEITSSTSSDIFCNTNTTVTNEKPELILENVIVTNTYHNTEEYLSSRGKCFRTYGFFKLTLSGTTDCPVYLDLYKGISWANYFELTNNTQSKIYVMGYNSEYGRSNALSYYITDNTLLDKFGAENTNWEIWKGYIKEDIKNTYLSHIKGAVNEEVLEIGPDGEKIDAYWITEEALAVVATVNGTNYYTLADALEASSSTYPAQLAGDVNAYTINIRNGNNCYLDLNTHTLTLNSGVANSQNSVENGQLHIQGTGTVNTSHPFYITGSSNSSASDYSVLTIGENVTVNYSPLTNSYPYVVWVAPNANNTAYGVRVNLAGTVNSTVSGAYINGNIQAVSAHAPIFNISGTLDAAITGIYAAGYGIWNITGTVKGNDGFGLGIKGGQLNMTAGKIYAGGDDHRVVGYNNGMYKSGAALQIESNDAYAGAMTINITGGELESNRGYAIYEYVAKSNDPTAVQTIAIANDSTAHKLNANDPVVYPLFQGGICISQSLAAKGGFVSGGKWSLDVTANIVKGKVANPISEDPYFFEVGLPTQETAEIVNDPSRNAVLTNDDGETYANSYTSENVGDDAEVKTSTATNQVVISQNTDVVVDKSDENNSTIVEVKKVTVDGNAQLNVKEGATLMVGGGSVLLNEETTTGGLSVEAGASLVVDGLVYGSTEKNFVIEGEEDKSGIVLFSPETEFIKEDHPKATYRFTSKSFRDGSKWVYQRFGMPSVDGNVTVKSGNLTYNSYICTWDYAADAWGAWRKIEDAAGLVYTDAVPFQCYELGSTNPKLDSITYEFIVDLMGNSNAPLNFKPGWNPYANSYTAPIDIKTFLEDVIEANAANGNDIMATIYLYKDLGNDTYTWQGINLSNVGKTYRVRENGTMVKKFYESSIKPMQAFIMKLSAGDSAVTEINYKDNVYDPAMSTSTSAPARSRGAFNEMQIGAYNDLYWDNISVMEGEQFSAAEDNGYDAPKYDHNKGLSLYVINGTQHMERVATDNADGMFIGINAPVAGTYTLDFSGIVGMNYSIIDMTNNAVVAIEEDGQFNFYAEAGQNDYRFQIVAPARIPTAIEYTGINANMKGVYTITGQYLGEDINALPKGVYIMNGAKVVK